MNESIKPGRYRHFKGREYQVIDIALHSETEQPHVVYRPLYGEGRLWIRPLELFNDYKLQDGRRVGRFERIGEPEPPDPDTGLQRRIAAFCRQHAIQAAPAERLLDLCSELGELAKVWLKGSDYGQKTPARPDPAHWQAEFGDTLFALLCLANESGVDAETALEQTLNRYQRRIESGGHPGSDAA